MNSTYPLTPVEQICAEIMRRLVQGAPAAGAPPLANTFGRLLRTLNDAARRKLLLHNERHWRLSADEESILALIASLQHDQRDRADALACWLAQPYGQAGVVEAAESVAIELDAMAATLPRYEPALPNAKGRPAALVTTPSRHPEHYEENKTPHSM